MAEQETIASIILDLRDRVARLENENDQLRQELNHKLSTHDINDIARQVENRLIEQVRQGKR